MIFENHRQVIVEKGVLKKTIWSVIIILNIYLALLAWAYRIKCEKDGIYHGWIDKKEVAIAQAYNYWERRLAKSWRKLCTGCQMRKRRGKTQKSWIWTEYSQLKLISDQVGPKRQHRTVPDQLSEHCRGFMCCMAWQG